ncbi:MAG: ABC transporter ATP-binding protein [Promethearchaeota archaeon]
MTKVIETFDLIKVYKGKKDIFALNGINLSIDKGKIFSFLGPNGAGKTTTVRILSSLIKPTKGEAFIFGHSVLEDPVWIRKHIGVLTENPGLYEKMTVKENLEFFGQFYIDDKANLNSRMNELLNDFNLQDRINDKVGSLSKGLKQRVALVKTLLHDPDLIFLDEPTSGLDPKASVEFREYISFLCRKMSKTIFICTHNLPEAQKLSDIVAVIDKGNIKRVGKPTELEKDLFKSTVFNITSTASIPLEIEDFINKEYKVHATVDKNIMKLFLLDEISRDVIPKIVRDLVNKQLPIYQVTKEEKSLEDVYLLIMEES